MQTKVIEVPCACGSKGCVSDSVVCDICYGFGVASIQNGPDDFDIVPCACQKVDEF